MFNLIDFKKFYENTNFFQLGFVYKFLLWIFIVFSILFSFYCASLYPGNKLLYLFFSCCFISLLSFSFFKEKFFYIDIFFSLYLWISFWLKFSLYIYKPKDFLILNVGRFYFQTERLDEVLLISIACALSFMSAILLRSFFCKPTLKSDLLPASSGAIPFYQFHRLKLIASFIIFVICISYLNFKYNIYQRGLPFADLNFLTLGTFKWLFQFGLSSFALFIANQEFKLHKSITFISLIIFIEIFFTNITTLSRGAIISGLPYVFALIMFYPKIKLSQLFPTIVLAFLVFTSSASVSNYLRKLAFSAPIAEIKTDSTPPVVSTPTIVNAPAVIDTTPILVSPAIPETAPVAFYQPVLSFIKNLEFPDLKVHIIDRVIGIEGIMAVNGFNGKGWNIFKEALNESSSDSGTSFYDTNILHSAYMQNNERFLFANLMGIFAFLYYPGSLVFIFFSFIIIYILFSSIEYLSWRLGGFNMFFTCLVGHTLAYRLIHFGYAPKQTYLLLLTLIANIFIFQFLIFLLMKLQQKKIN